MQKRAAAFLIFSRYFFRNLLHVREVISGLFVLLLVGGFAISKIEGIGLGKAVYFALITGLTIGYGDITPETAWGKVVSVMIGLVGMLFTGLTIAIATRSLSDLVRDYESQK